LTVQVLIVDDQATFRRAAVRVLARLPGFVVASGEASVQAARELQPEAEATGRPPVVFLLSTYEAADYAPQTIACGAAGVPGQS
jgi:hypothetical protein